MIMNNPAIPISSGLANGLPVSSSPAPKAIGNTMQSAFMVANVLFLNLFY